jgi:hypothetical protein
MRDFTLTIYQKLLRTLLEKGYSVRPVKEAYSTGEGKSVLLRHDVDACPLRSLAVARLEKESGVFSTFYFKTSAGSFDEPVIREIADMGHEIGYHYEDLAVCKGNYEKAIASFERNLSRIRQLYPVSTISMDGHVLSSWNNLDLWKKYDYAKYGIRTEPYLDLDFDDYLYLTDTGRRWNAFQFSLYDKVRTKYSYRGKSTRDLISDLTRDALPARLLVTTHPQRWMDDPVPWLMGASL